MMLSDKELEQLKNMMSRYKSIHEELANHYNTLTDIQEGKKAKNEDELKVLREKVNFCVSSLEDERKKEKDLYQELEKKYGPGHLDVHTLEYKPKNER